MRGEFTNIVAGTLAQEMKLDVLSNNMANANTVGFKGDHVFQIPSTSSDSENLSTASVKDMPMNNISMLPVGTYINFIQGSLKETGNTLDVALEGEGFFCVQTPRGNEYTRKGDFVLNSSGTLVTQQGYPVLGKGGNEIQISGRQVVVGSQGGIIVDGVEADSLKIVNFPNQRGLIKNGDSFFSPIDLADQGVAVENVMVQQGYIEGSNVDSLKMMTEMIEVIRGYESYQKVLQSFNETNSKTVNELGKLS